jgi:hypothetical protein
MDPWRVGAQYDRPIPRRIVESCGVPRHMFGQEKKAIAQPLWTSPVLERRTTVPWRARAAARLRTLRVRILDRLARTRFHLLLQRPTLPRLLRVDVPDRTTFTLLTSVIQM